MKEEIIIPTFYLDWSDWFSWNSITEKGKLGSAHIPSKPGVYEARLIGSEELLTIGRGSDLYRRIREGLVKGILPHSTGKRIRNEEDVSKIEIRWAITDRPCACEEELHIRYQKQHGKLPKHTKNT
jgi:hypothetical protein